MLTPLLHPFSALLFLGKMLLLALAVGETETGAEVHRDAKQWLAER